MTNLICSESSHYELSYKRDATKTITLLKYAFFNDFTEVCHLDGKLAYRLKLPESSSKTKIKDIIACPNDGDLKSPNFLIALTSNNYLAFFDLDNGERLKYVSLAPTSECKFRYIDWNLVNKSFVVTSTIQVPARQTTAVNTTHFAIFEVYPLRVVAKFSLRSDVFGHKCTMKINEGMVYLIFPGNRVDCYELNSLLVPVPGINLEEAFSQYEHGNGIPDTHTIDTSKIVDGGTGKKLNLAPLLSLKSDDHFLDFSDSRCFYITKNSKYNILHLDSDQLVGDIAITNQDIDEEVVYFLRRTNQVLVKQNHSISLYHIELDKPCNNLQFNSTTTPTKQKRASKNKSSPGRNAFDLPSRAAKRTKSSVTEIDSTYSDSIQATQQVAYEDAAINTPPIATTPTSDSTTPTPTVSSEDNATSNTSISHDNAGTNNDTFDNNITVTDSKEETSTNEEKLVRTLRKRFEICHNKEQDLSNDTTAPPITPPRLQRRCKTTPTKVYDDDAHKIYCCTYDEALDLIVVGMQGRAYIYNKYGKLVKSIRMTQWDEDWDHELGFSSDGEYLVHISQSLARDCRIITYKLKVD